MRTVFIIMQVAPNAKQEMWHYVILVGHYSVTGLKINKIRNKLMKFTRFRAHWWWLTVYNGPHILAWKRSLFPKRNRCRCFNYLFFKEQTVDNVYWDIIVRIHHLKTLQLCKKCLRASIKIKARCSGQASWGLIACLKSKDGQSYKSLVFSTVLK